MSGFKPGIFGDGSNNSANWATNTALKERFLHLVNCMTEAHLMVNELTNLAYGSYFVKI